MTAEPTGRGPAIRKVRAVRRKLRLLLAMTALATVTASVTLAASPAEAAVATSWVQNKKLPGGGNGFDNYDYTTKARRANNVDWAVDLLWTNNATIGKTSAGWSKANPKWVRGSVAFGYVNAGWDENKGLKQYSNGKCKKRASNYHYRVYAHPSTDVLVSTNYGYFVIGTAHDDYAENCAKSVAKTWHQEAAEAYVAGIFAKNGYTVRKNKINLTNAQSNNEYVNGVLHDWDNNGKATQIVVP